MARRQVVEIVCDRCTRTDIRKPEEMHDGAVVEITFKGETVKYEDLCRRCEDTIGNQFMRITKQKDEEPAKTPDGQQAPKKPGLLSRVTG